MAKRVNFEDKIDSAKKLLEKLSLQDIPLDESIKAYEAGMKELKAAQKILEDASLQIEEIKKS